MRGKTSKTKKHKPSLFLSVLGIVLILVVGFIGYKIIINHPINPSFSASEQQKLDEVVKTYRDKFPIPGVIAGIWVPKKGTYIKGYGVSDLATQKAMDPHVSFRIASLTKTFVATVLLQLVDEGKINLDDPLSNYIKDSGIPNADTITIRQLANMTSGLFDYPTDEVFDKLHEEDRTRFWEPKELLSYATKHPPYFAPGTSYKYTNTNYILLGMVIEKVTGNSVKDEIQNRIATPLNLKNTYYATDTTLPRNAAHGYTDSIHQKNIDDVSIIGPSYAGAAGAMISNIEDLGVWAKAYGTGKLISKHAYQTQTTWVDEPNSPQVKYGIGMMKVGNFIGHTGVIDGYNLSMFYEPVTKAAIVIVQTLNPGTAEGSADKIGFMMAKVIIPDRLWW